MMRTIVLVEKIVLVRIKFVFLKKLSFDIFIYQILISAGCPCESFDCDSLNEIAESCKDQASNKNYQFCYDEQRTSLNQCLDKCETYDCHFQCSETFEEQLERCPCAQQCPCKLFLYSIYVFQTT